MTLRLWKGYHSPEIVQLVRSSWMSGDGLILCPPLLRDFSFLSALPQGPLEFHGDFSDAQKAIARAVPRAKDFASRETPVFGVFTSGTMSLSPRLVLYSRENIECSLSAISALFDPRRIDHVFCFPQPFHVFGLTLGYVLPILLDRPLKTPHGKYGTGSLEERQNLREKNVLTLGTPTHFYDWAKAFEAPAESYSCIAGGAAVSRTLWNEMQNALRIQEPSVGYGCSEASPGITHLPPGVAPAMDGDVGAPLSSLSSRLVPDVGVEIEGDSLCLAIVQNGEIQFPRKLLIRDRLRAHSAGHWIYEGRTDLLLNRGGQKFSLEHIEQILWRDLGLQAVAAAVPDQRLGHDLGLALRGEARLETISASLKREFGLALNPEFVVQVREFPLNESAKLDRRAVAQILGRAK